MDKGLKGIREEQIVQLEDYLKKSQSPDDDMFYTIPPGTESSFLMLDDINFFYNKVMCPMIERLLPTQNKLVTEEQQAW